MKDTKRNLKQSDKENKKTPAVKKIITPEKMQEAMDFCYNAALKGIPGGKTSEQLAKEYLSHQHSKNELENRRKAAESFVKWQISKCTATGIITGIPGGLAMIGTIPADITSTLYIQLRMIATVAVIGGYDVNDDVVQSMIYCCLGCLSVNKAFAEAGIRIGDKAALAGLKKLPGKILTAINKKVGFRLFTKFGKTGVINLAKLVPIAGGIIGGGFNFAGTAIIAKYAQRQFIENIFDNNESAKDEVIIESAENDKT